MLQLQWKVLLDPVLQRHLVIADLLVPWFEFLRLLFCGFFKDSWVTSEFYLIACIFVVSLSRLNNFSVFSSTMLMQILDAVIECFDTQSVFFESGSTYSCPRIILRLFSASLSRYVDCSARCRSTNWVCYCSSWESEHDRETVWLSNSADLVINFLRIRTRNIGHRKLTRNALTPTNS